MKAICLLLLSWVLSVYPLVAQPAPPEEVYAPAATHESSGAPTLLGITILGNPNLGISNVEGYRNGVSITHNTLQLSVSIGLGWSLQVRAVDDLRSGAYSIPLSAVAVQSTGIGSNRPEVILSTVNQTLASGLATTLLNSILPLRYRLIGGDALLKPSGNYTTTLIFSYTAQ